MKVNTPKRRFKGFSENWEQEKLKNISTVSSCKRIYKNETHELGEIPFYKIGTIGKKPDSYITREIFENYKQNYDYPDYGDTIITASGSIGRLFQYQGEEAYFQDSNLVWLNFKLEMNKDYTYYYLNRIRWAVEGTTITRLYNKNILSSIFKYPNLEEQNKIAEFIGTIDKLLTLHKRKFEKLKQLQKSYLNESVFSEPKRSPKRRFKGFVEPWEQYQLSEVTNRVRGNDGNMSLPTLTISAREGWLDQKDRFSKNIAGNQQKNYTQLKYGQLSYNKGNSKAAPYGVVYMLNTHKEALVPSIYHSFEMIDGEPKFLEYLFSSRKLDRELRKYVSSSARMDGLLNITYQNFEKVELNLPQKYEQLKVKEFLKKLDLLLTLHKHKHNAIKILQKIYLQNNLKDETYA